MAIQALNLLIFGFVVDVVFNLIPILEINSGKEVKPFYVKTEDSKLKLSFFCQKA